MPSDPLEELRHFFRERDFPPPAEQMVRRMQVNFSGKRRYGRFVVEYRSSVMPPSTGSAHFELYDYGSLVKRKRMSGVKYEEVLREFERLSDIARRIPKDTPSWQIEKMVSGRLK